MSNVSGLLLNTSPSWLRRLGFSLNQGLVSVSNLQVFAGGHERPAALVLENSGGVSEVDGVPVVTDLPEVVPSDHVNHENQVVRVEALVIQSPDWERTTLALKSLGMSELNVRTDIYPNTRLSLFQAGTPTHPLTLELVAPLTPASSKPSLLWGVTWQVDDDLTSLRSSLTPPAQLSKTRAAVQQGRNITTLAKGHRAGLEMAFMTRSPRAPES